ncbi:S8 family serine peptidase [Amycolatopsis sp. NPDC059657]|uniref:S8 family serine peptidase n=1 Tax=Amycolatopsis sp. NPDC059657 TaxID=3346899 RepID=UPI00367049B9
MKRILAVTGVCAALTTLTPLAHAQQNSQCANPSGRYAGGVPWGQKLVDPAKIWPLTTGSGQTVAVLAPGFDGDNGQFGPDQILGNADSDCDGRGTVAAGIVGAQKSSATTFTGVAPGVKLLPVKADPANLAAAIDTAAQAKAGVILVAVPSPVDNPALTAAVANAKEKGSVVIAPAGATQQGARSYPAATPGVLAVGSVNQAGEPVQQESGDYIRISAPGADLVSTSADANGQIAHRYPISDPSLAAAYVAGAAALVRAYHPTLTPDQVVTRLLLTANRPASGAQDLKRGWGMLDAYAAVSAQIPADAMPPGVQGKAAGSAGSIVPAQAARRPESDTFSGVIAVAGVGAAVVAGIAVAAVRSGRKRGWRPGRFKA